MTVPTVGGASRATPAPAPEDASTGELIGRLTEQIGRLVRDEARLAQAEVTQKAKRLGVGAGLFGGAGLFAFLGLAVLVAAVVLLLALALPHWLAALIVACTLFAIAGILALIGRRGVQQAAPPLPTQAIESTKADIAAVRRAAAR